MIKVKARNASNSTAIAKFRNAEINYFVPKMVDHDLVRGSQVPNYRPGQPEYCTKVAVSHNSFLVFGRTVTTGKLWVVLIIPQYRPVVDDDRS